jgi:hypothetical protein
VGVGDVDDPPPQPTINRTKTAAGAYTKRRRRPKNSRLETPRASVHPTNQPLRGKSPNGPLTALPDAVVVTDTVTQVAEVPVTLTDPGTLQIGVGLAAGVIAHVKFTIPLNEPAGVSSNPKVAVPPAVIVDELDPPDGMPNVKSDETASAPISTTCKPFTALSETVKFAVAFRRPLV